MIKNILHFIKSFPKIRFSYKIGRQLLPKTPYYQVKPALKRVLLSTNRYGPQYISLVQRMGKLFFTPFTHARPNSLIRAFNSVSTLVRFRYETPLNEPYDKLRSNFVNNLRFDSIKLGKYISKGAHGAVWAAQCLTNSSTVDHEAEGESKEVVVKLLYNYYASSTDQDGQPLSTSPDQWTLLHEQRRREINLRPPGRHPNIVPILRDFFDRVPSSGKEATLERVEDFPEGFGRKAHTYYFVMPRFDGSLEDLVKGKWRPIGTLSPNIDSVSSPTRQEVKIKESEKTTVDISVPSSPAFSLPPEEAIGVAVQMIEAVAQLERYHIAHRDIKPSNFLIKSRSPSSRSNLLNGELAKLANTRLHVALTDFGCAIRTDTALANGNILSHSGNTSLWAPEVAEYFAKQNQRSKNCGTTAVYKRSDLWATATIVYQLFGERNPFLSGKLASKDYTESQLPEIPTKAPTVLGWLLGVCLRRDPSFRPSALQVADVLHTWCLLQLLKRILPDDQYKDAVPHIPLPAELLADKFINPAKSSKNTKEVWIAIEMQAMRFARRLRRRSRWPQHNDDSLRDSLVRLLNLLWTVDFLLGPAKADLGIRSLFYQRITLEKFAYCLAFVQLAENRPLIY